MLDSLSFKKTYEGWLEGVPTPRQERRCLNERLAEARRLSGRMPVVLLPSARVVDGPHRDRLPYWFCTAGLICYESFGGRMASGLTLCFLEEEPFESPPSTLVVAAAATVVWRDNARGFDW